MHEFVIMSSMGIFRVPYFSHSIYAVLLFASAIHLCIEELCILPITSMLWLQTNECEVSFFFGLFFLFRGWGVESIYAVLSMEGLF